MIDLFKKIDELSFEVAEERSEKKDTFSHREVKDALEKAIGKGYETIMTYDVLDSMEAVDGFGGIAKNQLMDCMEFDSPTLTFQRLLREVDRATYKGALLALAELLGACHDRN